MSFFCPPGKYCDNIPMPSNISSTIHKSLVKHQPIPTIPSQKIPELLPPSVCQIKPTSTSKITYLPPFSYDITDPKNQPRSLQTLKTMHNQLSQDIISASEGYKHFSEPIIKTQVIKNLKNYIEKFCYDKETYDKLPKTK